MSYDELDPEPGNGSAIVLAIVFFVIVLGSCLLFWITGGAQ